MTLEQLLAMGNKVSLSVTIDADSEGESNRYIAAWQDSEIENAFKSVGSKVKYHEKVDKKSGELTEQGWKTTVIVDFYPVGGANGN